MGFLSFLYLTVLSSSKGFRSDFAQSPEERKQVNGIVGGSVTFLAPVLKTGSLLYKDLGAAAVVFDGRSGTDFIGQFRGRLQWDSQTGLFTITHLRTEDSGIYVVDSTEPQKKLTPFQLEVYKNVATPTVTWLQLERNCSVLCSVENGREVTLSWKRDGEVLFHTSSPDINGSLSLPLEIDNNNHSYSCDAKNPVSLQLFLLEVPSDCIDDSDSEVRVNFGFTRVLIALLVMAVIGLAVSIVLLKATKLEHTDRRYEERVRYELHCADVSTRTRSKVKLLQGGAISKLDSPTEVRVMYRCADMSN